MCFWGQQSIQRRQTCREFTWNDVTSLLAPEPLEGSFRWTQASPPKKIADRDVTSFHSGSSCQIHDHLNKWETSHVNSCNWTFPGEWDASSQR